MPYRRVGDVTLCAARQARRRRVRLPDQRPGPGRVADTGDAGRGRRVALADRRPGPDRARRLGRARTRVCGVGDTAHARRSPRGRSTCGSPRSCPADGPLHVGHPRRSRPTWTGSACRPRTPVCWPTRPEPARTVAPPACRRCGRRSAGSRRGGPRGARRRTGPQTTRWCARWSGSLLGLVGLTVLIAVVGVGTTTALSVVERVRESGLLRAIGLSRTGLRTMLTVESGLYGVIGATHRPGARRPVRLVGGPGPRDRTHR